MRLKIISLVTLFVILYSCKVYNKDDSKQPDAVAVKFLTCMSQLKFDEAKKYGTPKTNQMLEVFIMTMDAQKKKDSTFVPQTKDLKIEILKCEKQGGFAIVTYKTTETPEDKLELVKQDGKWYVDLKKEGLNLNNFKGKPIIKNH